MGVRIIDITMPLHPGIPVWPGDPEVEFEPVSLGPGDGPRVARIALGTHSGTHVDAPRHYIPDGPSVDRLELEHLCGQCTVVDVTGMSDEEISQVFEQAAEPRVLMKSSNADARLGIASARAACSNKIVLIGTESLSIETDDGSNGIHSILLAAGIVIVESVVLAHVTPGPYRLTVLPLPLVNMDGSPCRAILEHTS